MPAFKKVLFIDDDIITISICERLLKLTDFTTEFISTVNGSQAKEYLLNNRALLPEIIFVDLYMTIMSGTEFLNWFDKWCAKENLYIPVYVLSSSLAKHDLDLALKFRVNDYIVKPLKVEHLDEIAIKNARKLEYASKFS